MNLLPTHAEVREAIDRYRGRRPAIVKGDFVKSGVAVSWSDEAIEDFRRAGGKVVW